MDAERYGTAPTRSAVRDRHDDRESGAPPEATAGGEGWAAPLLGTAPAEASPRLALGAARPISPASSTVATPRSGEEMLDEVDSTVGEDRAEGRPVATSGVTVEAAGQNGATEADGPAAGVDSVDQATATGAPTGPVAFAVAEVRDRGDRRKRRQRTADDEGEDGDPLAGLGPMVRHLSTMTKELSEAQRTVGRLTAERDLLRQQLGEEGAGASGSVETTNGRPNKEARVAARQAARGNPSDPAEIDGELAIRAAEVGRRRRMIALGVLGALVATMAIWRLMGWPSPIEDVSKRGLTGIAYIGPFMNILIGGFLIYRLVRVGGKAGGWLFPSAEEPKRRRR